MNYAGTFGTDFLNDAPVSLTDHQIKMDSAGGPVAPGPVAHETIIVPDAQLLFAGDFNRLGNDLVLSKDGHEFVVSDYFRSEKRAFLASPDGANLSGDVVQALTGHVQYAQAGGAQSAPKDIGQVSKLVGSATVIRNGVLVELHGGDRVYKGDVVQAGANSSCTIVFVDGSVFGLSANARMVLNEMVYDQAGASNSALISLVRGTISFVAGETAKHGDMKVETPVATMGIRGTAVLVEIGFEIPSDGKGPPVNFQVLVEPDGTTGSYVVYSKSDPTVVIGTIDKAGQVFSVSGNGTFSNLPSPEMSQLAASIIQQVFTQRFQGYVPDKPISTPQSGGGGGGSPPPSPPGDNIPKLHDTPDGPVIIPITVKVPDGSGGTKEVTIPVHAGVADVAPTITLVNFSVFKNGTTLLSPSNITVLDPDNNSFTFAVTALTHGHFEIKTTGNSWTATTTFTTADILAGHVRFVADNSGSPPTFSLTANDGHLNSVPFNVTVELAPSSLTSTEGVSINTSPEGATAGFKFPGAGNVTTPGTPEDRIVLGYNTGDPLHPIVLNSAPMLSGPGNHDFTPSSPILDGRSVVNELGAGNGITLTQTITLGANANYFTTAIDIHNGSGSTIDGVRFLRNFDPDQDIQIGGGYATFNDVVHNPTADEPFAIVSARGPLSGVTVSMIGIGLAWRASVYGFTNTDPYYNNAAGDPYAHPYNPNGALADLSLTLTYDFGSIDSGSAYDQHITFITTNNVATSGDNALFGTTGADIIDGHGGSDLLIGLGGADTFIFAAGNVGVSTIYDFTPGTDKILLTDFASVFNPECPGSFEGWLTAHASPENSSDLRIDLDLDHPGQNVVILKNVSIDELTSADFQTDHAPTISTDGLTVSSSGSPNSDVTISGLSIADQDEGDTVTLSASTSSSGSSVSVPLPSNDIGTLNTELSTTGLIYHPGSTPPQTDKVTVTITDKSGASDQVNFIFNVGGTGPVTLNGTWQKDVFFATGYQDTFVFAAHSGQDKIIGFDPTQDKIELNGLSSIPTNISGQFTEAELTAMKTANALTQVGSDTLIHLDGTDTLLLKNVTLSSLTANDFIIHPGTA